MAYFRDQSPVYFTKSRILAVNFGYHPYNETDVLSEKIKHLNNIFYDFRLKTGLMLAMGERIMKIEKSSRFEQMTVVYLLIEEDLVHHSIERIDADFWSFISW